MGGLSREHICLLACCAATLFLKGRKGRGADQREAGKRRTRWSLIGRPDHETVEVRASSKLRPRSAPVIFLLFSANLSPRPRPTQSLRVADLLCQVDLADFQVLQRHTSRRRPFPRSHTAFFASQALNDLLESTARTLTDATFVRLVLFDSERVSSIDDLILPIRAAQSPGGWLPRKPTPPAFSAAGGGPVPDDGLEWKELGRCEKLSVEFGNGAEACRAPEGFCGRAGLAVRWKQGALIAETASLGARYASCGTGPGGMVSVMKRHRNTL